MWCTDWLFLGLTCVSAELAPLSYIPEELITLFHVSNHFIGGILLLCLYLGQWERTWPTFFIQIVLTHSISVPGTQFVWYHILDCVTFLCNDLHLYGWSFISIIPNKPIMSSGSWMTLLNCEIYTYLSALIMTLWLQILYSPGQYLPRARRGGLAGCS